MNDENYHRDRGKDDSDAALNFASESSTADGGKNKKNDGQQSKGSLFTSLTVNVMIAIVVCILGAAAKKSIEHHRLTELTMSPLPKQPPPEPPKPKAPPPPKK